MESSLIAQQDGSSSVHQKRLSVSQQRLWVLEGLQPRNPAHNVCFAMRLYGRLDAEKLEQALQEVTQSYEILRTEFHIAEGIPHGSVLPLAPLPLIFANLQADSHADREALVQQLLKDEVRRSFDLSAAPLLRASLWRLQPSEHIFLLVAHRIICDDPSLHILLREIAERYAIGKSAPKTPANTPRLQFSEWASHQNPASENAPKLAYWKQRLADVPASLDLPTDSPRPAESTFRGASQKLLITHPLLNQVKALARAHDATFNETLLAAFTIFLSRYNGEEDVLVGITISGRNSESETLVGPAENVVMLRADLSNDPTFSDLLTRIHYLVAQALAHQQVRFETLLDELPLEADLSRNPLFQVAFSQQPVMPSIESAGIKWQPIHIESATELLDLSVSVIEHDDHGEARFSYSTDLFDASTIARMLTHFQTLLQSATENPNQAVSLLPLLTEAERHQVVVQWNDPTIKYPAAKLIHELVEAQVARIPHAIAVSYDGQTLTYDALNRRANQLAHYLRQIGVKPDDRVAMCLERGFEMVVAILAVLKAGGGYVPLDPAYPADRLRYTLEDSGASVLLTQTHLRKLFDDATVNPPVVILGESNSAWSDLPETNPARSSVGLNSAHLAYVIYTSGSTGAPKGVMVEHRNVTRLFAATDDWYHFNASDVWSLFHSSAFDFSVWEMWGAFFYGGRLVIVPQNTARSPEDFYSLMCREGVTVLNQTPSAFRQLIAAQNRIVEKHNLRYVIFGGEALELATLKPWYAESRNEQTLLVNMYGITETTVHVTYRPLEASDTERRGASPIGVRIPDLRTYILDKNRQPVPIGVVGELHVGGAGVARGYLNHPELTAERFLANPFVGGDERMYKAGDLGRWLADGSIEFLGRNDSQVKIRGFRIELGEIEARLAECEGVEQAVVIAREDTAGEKRLIAYLVPDREYAALATTTPACTTNVGSHRSSAQPFITALKNHLKGRLPEYMVPAAFVMLESLPLTENGKLNVKALPPPGSDAYATREYEAPQGEIEALLTGIWKDALKLDKIGRHDNFFDLGGHSLTAARILAQVKESTGRQIPLSALFRGATIESLAQLIGEGESNHDPVVMKIQNGDGTRLPFFAIVPPGEESLGYAMLARHMGPSQTVYKIQGHAPVVGASRPYTEQEMQQISEEYIAAMRSVQPQGPYCVGGECDGTHIAEQVVLRLEAHGEQIGLFAIFDTWVMQNSQRRWLWKLDYYRRRLRQMKDMKLADRVASYKHVAETKLDVARGKKAPRTDWRATYWPQNFTPPRFRAPVILFKRPKQQFFYVNDPQMGWGQRSEGGVEIHEVEFHHREILREPHVGRFGEILAECMIRTTRQLLAEMSERNGASAGVKASVSQQ